MLARRAVWQGLSAISVARQSQYMLLPLTITGGTAGADLLDALRADGVDLNRDGDDRKTWKIKAEYSTIAMQSLKTMNEEKHE